MLLLPGDNLKFWHSGGFPRIKIVPIKRSKLTSISLGNELQVQKKPGCGQNLCGIPFPTISPQLVRPEPEPRPGQDWNLVLAVQCPANSARIRRVVVLTLHYVLRAAVVEPKYFVVQVQAVSVHLEAALASCSLPAYRTGNEIRPLEPKSFRLLFGIGIHWPVILRWETLAN